MSAVAKKPLIGLTGGIGAGKSTATRIFKLLKVPVYDADKHAQHYMQKDTKLRASILSYFGKQAYTASGTLNTAYLSHYIFQNPEARHWINTQVHPIVHRGFYTWIQAQSSQSPYFIYEAALLFETQAYKKLHRTLLVVAPQALRIKRILDRDPQRNTTEIKYIIAAQLPENHKKKRAGKSNILRNDEHTLLLPQILKVHQEIIQRSTL